MNDDTAARFLIEMRAEAFDAARTHGGLCAICGRALADDEPVWVERIPVPGEPRASLRAPVGRECASLETLDQSDGHEAERCAGCGRGVYYARSHARRRQALCSKRCLARTVAAKKQRAKSGKGTA